MSEDFLQLEVITDTKKDETNPAMSEIPWLWTSSLSYRRRTYLNRGLYKKLRVGKYEEGMLL